MTARQHQQRFEALLHEHRRIVFKVSGLYSRTLVDREDLVQEICLQVWRSFGRHDERRAKFSTMVAFAGRLLFQLQAIDYAAPVLEIQRRLARLRAWRVGVEAPTFAILGSVVWVPAVLMLIQYDFDPWGDDYWRHAPDLAGGLMLSGLASLLLVVLAYWLIRRAGHRRWLENNFAGSAVRKAERMLQEIARFERE